MMSTDESSRWHQKYVILCIILVWMFHYRFRIAGYLLSKVLTLLARWKEPFLLAHVEVQIQEITFHPFQFVHVEIRSMDEWNLIFTRVTIESHLLEFFRSFVQKKILLVLMDQVELNMHHIDDHWIRELVQASIPKTNSSSSTTYPSQSMY